MNALCSYVSNSLVSKFALNVVSTATAYILVPTAFHYAEGGFNKTLVLAIIAMWALALTRMWGEVISLTAQAAARIEIPAVVQDLAISLPALDEVAIAVV